MNKKWIVWGVALLALMLFLSPEIAHAAPGGIVKAASKIGIGKILFLVFFGLIFAPFVIYTMIRSAKNSKKTLADLEMLSKTHPQYAWLDTKDRAIEVFYWVWSAWKDQKMSQAANFTTPWYWQNQQHILDEWRAQGIENVCRVQEISDVKPLFVQHNAANNGEGSRLVVSISAKVVDYLRKTDTGEIVKGDEKEGDLQTVWTFKWEGGAWRLNLIEPSEKEWDYEKLVNVVPVAAPSEQGIAQRI
ncbi:MAG TPA: hypothetical protein VGB45_03805 [Abditibacterium sp.]|jgi:hypothetical protein